MTYCLAMSLDQGLVFASDCRTNAGADHISTFRKMRVWERAGERVIVLLSAGNLALTQSVAAVLERRIRLDDAKSSLMQVDSLHDAARLVGDAVRAVHQMDAKPLKEAGVEFNLSLILGGQIRGEPPRLFQVYAAGNFIEATPETPFFQIGETKYGKPILDRVVRMETDLTQAAKCALLSLDSTLRSNVTVGLPIDLLIYPRDGLTVGIRRVIDEFDPYFNDIRHRWSQGLNDLFQAMPDPPWTCGAKGA
jgi:putative proteasome-type protease